MLLGADCACFKEILLLTVTVTVDKSDYTERNTTSIKSSHKVFYEMMWSNRMYTENQERQTKNEFNWYFILVTLFCEFFYVNSYERNFYKL